MNKKISYLILCMTLTILVGCNADNTNSNNSNSTYAFCLVRDWELWWHEENSSSRNFGKRQSSEGSISICYGKAADMRFTAWTGWGYPSPAIMKSQNEPRWISSTRASRNSERGGGNEQLWRACATRWPILVRSGTSYRTVDPGQRTWRYRANG